jgi:VWFA-related protein
MSIFTIYNTKYNMKTVLCFIYVFLSILSAIMNTHSYGETSSSTTKEQNEYSIKIGVEEVRIDAVVLNNKGKQVTDLAASEFEIYQDNLLQNIISSRYINELQNVSSPNKKVMRNIAIVVDDYSMTFEQIYYARMALQKYIEQQMQSGDNIALIRTSYNIGASQQFSSDKKYLLSQIKRLEWGRYQFRGLTSMQDRDDIFAKSSNSGIDTRQLISDMHSKIDAILNLYGGLQQAILNLSIAYLQDIPGRKYLLFVSPRMYYNGAGEHGKIMENKLIELAEKALRADVVIHTLDIKGLNISKSSYISEKYLPLSRMTGGTLIENNNYFLHGFESVVENMNGYYILSYIPPSNSFDSNTQKKYHRIKIKVKRRGCEVHGRDGFYGVPSLPYSSTDNKQHTLRKAIFSPFMYNDLKTILSTGYAYNNKSGYYLKTWVHIDGDNLAFRVNDTGEQSLSLEMEIRTSDADGQNTNSSASQYEFILSNDDITAIKSKGIDLSIFLPIKDPGDYYVCIAIRDKTSGKIGTGYQYLNIPNIKNGKLSLSNIFILNKGEDATAIDPSIGESNSVNKNTKWLTLPISPALRKYRPGDNIGYAMYVFNAINKENQKTKLELQYNIIKEGQIYYKGNNEIIDLEMDNNRPLPIIKQIYLDIGMKAGAYQLQIIVNDKMNKHASAVQDIEFQIVE